MPAGLFSGGTLSSFKSPMTFCADFLYLYFRFFLLFYCLLGSAVLESLVPGRIVTQSLKLQNRNKYQQHFFVNV